MLTFHPDSRVHHRNAYRARCKAYHDHCNELNSADSRSTKAHLRLADNRWCRRRCASCCRFASARTDNRRAVRCDTSPYTWLRETCRSQSMARTLPEFGWGTSLWRFDSSRGRSDTVSRTAHFAWWRTRAGSLAGAVSRENRSCEESTRNR